MNTQAQAHPTNNISVPVQHIVETTMVELQQTTFGIPGKIFYM